MPKCPPPKKEANSMKQVRIILKSGKELNFAAEDEEIHKEVITATDGVQYAIVKDAVEAAIIIPTVKCPHCGRWTAPTEKEVSYDDMIHRTVFNVCEYCGEPIK